MGDRLRTGIPSLRLCSAVMLCEGNRRSGVALAMRHRLPWFIHPGAHGVGKGDEHPAYTPVTRYGTPLHRSPMNTYFGVAAGPYVVARTRRGLGKREGRTSSCGREPTVDGQPGPGRGEHETEFQEQYLNHSSVSPPPPPPPHAITPTATGAKLLFRRSRRRSFATVVAAFSL